MPHYCAANVANLYIMIISETPDELLSLPPENTLLTAELSEDLPLEETHPETATDHVNMNSSPSEALPLEETHSKENTRKARPTDEFEPLRAKMRQKETVNARVVKWQKNGLDMEIIDLIIEGQPSLKAFLSNDNIDHDPNRNIANYFGKTLAVKITSVKAKPGLSAPEISLSHRAVLDEEARIAGHEAVKNLHVGDIVETKVKSFDHSNVKVDLGFGIEAVILLRDLSWEKVDHPYEILKRGETVTAKILSLDRGRREVRLGIRQLTPDPELAQYAEYAPGQSLKAKVVSADHFGAEIELPNGLHAFLPISEIAWQRVGQVSDVISVGDEFEVKLMSVDPKERRITASRKMLIEDPMRVIENTFRRGTDHNGTIKEINRGGLVITLEHGAEGFVPRGEVTNDPAPMRLEDVFKVGKPIEGLRVIEFERKGRSERGSDRDTKPRITLSLTAAEKETERNALKDYRATSKASRYSLSDSLAALRDKLAEQEKQ
jgi:ribosomal protein S1